MLEVKRDQLGVLETYQHIELRGIGRVHIIHYHQWGAQARKAGQEQHVVGNRPYLRCHVGLTRGVVHHFCDCLGCRWLPTGVHTRLRAELNTRVESACCNPMQLQHDAS